MAILLQGCASIDEPAIYLNIGIGRLATVPVKISFTDQGMFLKSAHREKFILPEDKKNRRATITDKDIFKAISISETTLGVFVSGEFGDVVVNALNRSAAIMIFALNYNTRFNFLGKKSINAMFFNSEPFIQCDFKMHIKLHFSGIIALFNKILFGR